MWYAKGKTTYNMVSFIRNSRNERKQAVECLARVECWGRKMTKNWYEGSFEVLEMFTIMIVMRLHG